MGRSKPLDPRSSLSAALGAKVRNLRLQQGWSQQELAHRVYISAARVAQIELATDPPTEDLAEDLDRVLQADDEINVAWYHMNRARHPSWARGYMDLERRATRIRCYAPQLVPGILQTAEYVSGLYRVSQPNLSEDGLHHQVEARLSRRKLLEGRNPLHLSAVLDESILLRPFSEPAIMRDQLSFLLKISEMPNVLVQVHPFSAGYHGAMDGPLSLMSFRDGPNLAYLEGSGAVAEVVESPDAVKLHEWVYERLLVNSLSPAASREMIRTTMEERYRCPPPLDTT